MRTRATGFLMLALTMVGGGGGAWASGRTQSTPVSERVKSSDTVVVATARRVEPTWKQGPFGDQIIVSRVLLEVSETLKGIPEPSAWVEIPGGTLGGVTLRVSGGAMVQEGERGVFFLDAPKGGLRAAHGNAEGLLKLNAQDTVQGTDIHLEDIRRVAAQNR